MPDPGWLRQSITDTLRRTEAYLQWRERLIAAGLFPDVPGRMRPVPPPPGPLEENTP